MRAKVSDPDVQNAVLGYLTRRPASTFREVAVALNMAPATCERVLLQLALDRRVKPATLNLNGFGRPTRLWSIVENRPRTCAPVERFAMTPSEMADDIASQLARQPWPAWFLLPGARVA